MSHSNRHRRLPLELLAMLFVGLGSVSEAKGYVDPGTGSMLWQVLVASAVGALFYLRRINPLRRLRSFWKRGVPEQ